MSVYKPRSQSGALRKELDVWSDVAMSTCMIGFQEGLVGYEHAEIPERFKALSEAYHHNEINYHEGIISIKE